MPSTVIENEPPVPAPEPRADVLFVHIPKTAGMSLYNSLATWFGPSRSLRYPRSTEQFKQHFLGLPDAELRRYRLLSGHFDLPFWLQREVGDRLVVSLVRDPIERVLSAYRFTRSYPQHPRHEMVGRMSPAEYVEFCVADTVRHNAQCSRLSKGGDFESARDMARRHVDLLGSVEQIALLTAALGERLGITLHLDRENRSPVGYPRQSDLDQSLIAKLQSCNLEDCKLWAYVNAHGLVRGHS